MTAETGAQGYLEHSLGTFLEAVAAGQPAPGGGAVAAVAVAMAAALTAMAGNLSAEHLPDADSLVARAEELRTQAGPLAQRDAAAYAVALTALAMPKEDHTRRDAVRRALSAAADVPLEVAEIGSEVIALALRLERDGNPNLVGDALTGRLLAAAGVRAAAALVEINLADATDARVARARTLADAARRSD